MISHCSPWLNGIASFVRVRGDKGPWCLRPGVACTRSSSTSSDLSLTFLIPVIPVLEIAWVWELWECFLSGWLKYVEIILEYIAWFTWICWIWILPRGVAWQCLMCWGTNSCALPWFMNLVLATHTHTHCAHCLDQSTRVSLATTTRLDTTCRVDWFCNPLHKYEQTITKYYKHLAIPLCSFHVLKRFDASWCHWVASRIFQVCSTEFAWTKYRCCGGWGVILDSYSYQSCIWLVRMLC